MNKEKLEQLAEQVSSKAATQSNNENFGSIILTVMIVGIIINLVRVAQECNKNKVRELNKDEKNKYNAHYIKKLCEDKGWFTKMKIKKAIRQQLGTEKYKEYNKVLLDSIMDTGEQLKEDELIELVEVSNNV
jgi:hypothetical protein